MWVETHLTLEEAMQCARVGGYRVQWQDVNIAPSGAAMHTEDIGAWALWEYEMRGLQQHIRYLLDIYQVVQL